jgi:hypothetical protein
MEVGEARIRPRPATIAQLTDLVEALPTDNRSLFKRLFDVIPGSGELRVPDEMSDWVTNQFGSVAAVEHQQTLRVINRWTLEESLFNGLRGQRPMASEPVDLQAAIAASRDDAFCHPDEQTPEDAFGRIRGGAVTTASNIAKYDAWSALLIFNAHDPLQVSPDSVSDMLSTAMEWCRRVREIDPEARYPIVLWNCLWPAGASVIHGHAQVALARTRPYAPIERWRLAAENYCRTEQRPYFDDLFKTHRTLGLAFERGTVRVLAHLTPVKEHEIVLLAAGVSNELERAVYLALATLIQRLGARSFNLALYHPPLDDGPQDWTDFPVVVRLVERRDPGVRTSDIGAFELFGASVIASDPFALAEVLRASFDGDIGEE